MSSNSKKCIAMIMNRYFIAPDSYVFSVNHYAIGNIDEQTNIFKDNNGNEYAPMLNPGLLKSEIPYAYNCVIELSQLKAYLGKEQPLRDSISEYEYICKRNMYYVAYREDADPICILINLDDLNNSISSMEESDDIERAEFEQEVYEEIDELIIDVINKKYSIDELKAIKDELKEKGDNIESALDTVDLQIEAMECNEGFTEHYMKKQDYKEQEETEDGEEKEEEKKEKLKIDIEDLFNKVTKTLIAQDEPARRVIVEIARKELNEKKKREGILLTGATGVGKTELMRLISKYIDRPFFKVDSTKLTMPGYVGKDIEEVLWDLYVSCGRDIEKCEHAIIYFDEIDKKGSAKKSDVSGQGVLNVLLPFIEGTTYDACQDLKNSANRVKIDTTNMIVILGGAYTDVYKNLLEKNIGFNSKGTTHTYRKATTSDFIEKAGMTDEFMGRVTIVKLNDLDVNDIKRVMLESDESALKIQEDIFNKLGVKITFTDSYVTAVAENAIERKTGARGLNGIIDETTWLAFNEVYNNEGKYKEVILSEETLNDPSSFKLVKKRKNRKKQ